MIDSANCIGTLFMTIPAQYNYIYEKILLLFSEYGLDAVKDCKVSCRDRQSRIVECFNIFTAGVAAWNAGRYKEASLVMNYVRGQIDIYYPNKTDNTKSIYFVLRDKTLDADKITEEEIKDFEIRVNNVATSYVVNCGATSELYIVSPVSLTSGTRTLLNSTSSNTIVFTKVNTIKVDDKDYIVYKPNTSFSNSTSVVTIL